MAWEWDDRAEFVEPSKVMKLLAQVRDKDVDLYAGLVNELCRAAGWNVMTLIRQTRTRLPGYVKGTFKDEWGAAILEVRATVA